jgi:formamidopyrimidine-DNA glycosylase
MPELPEVEVARRALERWFKGRKVVRAESENTRTFRGAKRADFDSIRGALKKAERRGKYLMLTFERDRGLVAHLGMTGKFVRRPEGQPERFSKARWVLDSGETIHFTDPRMFGRMEPVAASALGEVKAIAELGIDPLVDGLDWKQLKEALLRTSQDLKVALMDQSRITGLGNIHAAEALFRARLHPARKAKSLSDAEWKALTTAIHASIKFALDHEDGDEISYVEEPGSPNPFLIYGRAGEKCRRCGTKVQSFVQGGRTTHVCPKCQPRRPKR